VDNAPTNTICAIPDVLTRTTALTAAATQISSGGALNAPLGMVVAPHGDVIVVNGNDGNAIEVTPAGKAAPDHDARQERRGDLFGLAITPND